MRTLTAIAVLALFAGPSLAQHPSEFTVRDKSEIFIQHVVKFMKVRPEQYQAMVLEYEIGQTLAEATQGHDHQQGCIHEQTGMTSNFIENALVELHPDYAEARRLFDAAAGDAAKIESALAALDLLVSSVDPYLSAHARLLQAQLWFAQGKLDQTMALCEDISIKDRARLIEDHVACELIAKCFEKQEKPLFEFAQYYILLTDYEELPPEIKERATARAQTLSAQVGHPLQKVAGWMNLVEKALKDEVTGEPTQEQEREIVTALDKLIELQEAKERRLCGG